MKKFLNSLELPFCALCVLCGLNLIAAPLQWTCDWPEAKSQTFSLYQGETATFEPTFRVNGQLITNATIAAVWYQTNGMGNAWWKLDGNTFAPSNDVGAASYRFFVEAQAPSSKLYRANGALRMLPSPGFTPNAIEPPVKTLDFAQITVLNPPWSDVSADLTVATNAIWDAIGAAGAATNALSAVAFSGDYDDLDNQPTIPTTPEDIGAASAAALAAVSNEAQLVYRLYSGSNVVCEVTNYNSRTRAPQMRLLQWDGTNSYFEVWNESNGLTRVETAAKSYTDGKIAALAAECAPRAWSRVTSYYGVEAPSNTTWVSTPSTVLAGGLEYEKVTTTAGNVFILAYKGNVTQVYTNQASNFSMSAADGTEILAVEKTDSYLVGVDADSIAVSGTTITMHLPVVAANHPYVRYRQSLESGSWEKEEDGFTSPITVAWIGASGDYVCTVTSSAASGFFYFEYLQEGSTKIRMKGIMQLDGGVMCTDGIHYAVPVYSNGSIIWTAL